MPAKRKTGSYKKKLAEIASFFDDRLALYSGSMSFITIFSFVPFMMLCVFAFFLGLIEYIGGGTEKECAVAALRMLGMTIIFIYLLATVRLQDLTAAMVQQLKVPYEYAFMFTAGLRFVPDFMEENKAVAEAQSCRGLAIEGNFIKQVKRYMSVVRPLMLRSLGRSETMALSLELRGFGGSTRTFMESVSPKGIDYIFMLLISIIISVLVAINKNENFFSF